MKITSILKFSAVGALLFCNAFAATSNTNSPPDAAKEKTKICFHCKGSGKSKCTVPSCKDGLADCPGPCMKFSKGVWHHKEVAGHPPTDLWQDFIGADGTGISYNQNHVGQVVIIKDGKPVNIGKCTVCGGTTKVKCPTCKGTGEIVCPFCDGEKVVPDSWTAFDNPKLKDRPTHFKLKDGRVIVGRLRMSLGTSLTIRTENNKDIEIDTRDIVSQEKPPAAK